jgi:GTPase SAR1 family protein
MTDTNASTPTQAQAVLDALASGITAAHAYDRADLAGRLQSARDGLATPDVRLVVIGEFKQGKSSLINALLNSKVCPVDDDIATAVPTSIRHGDPRQAWVITSTDNEANGDAGVDREVIDVDDIGRYVTEGVAAQDVRGVEVALPRKLLERGLVLVDTPGVGGLGSAHATASLGALSVADAAIFISDASQEFTQTELNFLAQAVDMCPRVICVMTKIDFYPAWRRVKALNEQHLRNVGHHLDVLPVSSALRIEAIRRSDKVLNAESGFPGLLAVVDEVVDGAEERHRRRAERDLLAVTDQLIGQFETEAAVLDDPATSADVVARLEEAKARSERLKSQTSKWSVTLNDGVGDLTSNVDFDFRQRMRTVTAEADAAIEASDPLQTWAEFEPWLASRVSFDVVANYRLLTDSAVELSRTVAEHFELDSDQVLDQLDLQNPAHVLSRVSVDTSLEFEGMSAHGQGLTLLKGSYTGVLMFTMLGSMVGLALGPLAIGIGLAMGSKGLKTERDRQRTQRRAQAKVAVRKYSDEVTFQVGKDSRDTLRQTQRQLRDYYTARAEELHRSTTEALAAATKAAQSNDADRTTRRRNIDAELTRLRALRTRVLTLAGDVSAS